MADKFDNEALSQEALDALIDSVPTDQPAASAGETIQNQDVDIDPAGQAGGEPSGGYTDAGVLYADPTPSATLQMASFGASPSAGAENGNFDRVTDIPLDLTVELGRTRLLIKDILELGSGSIVELEKTAGEPVDLLANGLLIARGEVVVIDDNFGIRITEIITSADRAAVADSPAKVGAA